MHHLDATQVEDLKSDLLRQLEKLERSMRATDQASGPVALDQTAVGRLSRMDALQNQSLARNLQERERARLALILGALRRMEDGSYGLCASCGEAIPFGRLQVFPEAPECSACGAKP